LIRPLCFKPSSSPYPYTGSSSRWRGPTDTLQLSNNFVSKADLYPNYLISSKQKTRHHKLLLISEFPYYRIREGSVELWGFGDSDIPQPTVGFPHFRLKSIGPSVCTILRECQGSSCRANGLWCVTVDNVFCSRILVPLLCSSSTHKSNETYLREIRFITGETKFSNLLFYFLGMV